MFSGFWPWAIKEARAGNLSAVNPLGKGKFMMKIPFFRSF